ncbi:MAG: PAS domain-containing sensor histidine kinase [Sulfuricurvum sp.]|nr:PAS domain-containing sensor histidine kinase [Sulfuricurvum sp.]MDP3021899.1 PAS domain-containing sensor histidine kinase [Sulfuricurvum sp.]
MHKVLEIQLKKSFGPQWHSAVESPEMNKLLALVDQSYAQYDKDYQLLEHILEVNSTELTEANNNILKKHELLHSVTESIDDLIFYKDLNFRYIGCNSSFANFFGFSVENIIGKEDFELYESQYASLFREMDEMMLKEMKARTNNEWVKNIKGEDVYLLTTKAPLVNSNGVLFGLVGIARDITKEFYLEEEVKAQQAMLIQQNRLAALGEMIGNIAHQWRQPLNTLGLIVQDIQEAYHFSEVNEDYIYNTSSKAMEQINYMSQTIDDFRNFFSPNKDKKLFSISQSISDAIEMLLPDINKYEIMCQTTVDEKLTVYGLKNEFTQVLLNLIKNAQDALLENHAKDPRIHITAKNDDNKVEISIADNAGGISETIIDRIFEPYYTTKEEGKGTGIGLYMSKMIIEEHMDGLLSVKNTDNGVTFTILLDTALLGNKELDHGV